MSVLPIWFINGLLKNIKALVTVAKVIANALKISQSNAKQLLYQYAFKNDKF